MASIVQQCLPRMRMWACRMSLVETLPYLPLPYQDWIEEDIELVARIFYWLKHDIGCISYHEEPRRWSCRISVQGPLPLPRLVQLDGVNMVLKCVVFFSWRPHSCWTIDSGRQRFKLWAWLAAYKYTQIHLDRQRITRMLMLENRD